MRVFFSDIFELPLRPGHRFPMSKYRLLRDRVAEFAVEHAIEITPAEPATDEQFLLVHDREYLRRVVAGELTELEMRRIGFPWSPQLVDRSRRSTGATISAARAAFVDGVAVNLAGGTHHAFADRGQGYCVFNDVAVAIRVLQQERLLRRAVIIDCDVHQGNGTAALFDGDDKVFTFSMHGDRNFPFSKVPSDLDIALPDGTADAEYLDLLEEALENLLPLNEADAVFYLAGADAFEGDRLGRLKLTKTGLEQRDRLVFSNCRDRGLPIVVVMAGGYAEDVDQTVAIHATTVRVASEFASDASATIGRPGPS